MNGNTNVTVNPPPDKRLLDQFKLDRSQRISLLALLLIISQAAKYIGDGGYFTFFQMRWPAEYPKGNAVYADWYIGDLWDRAPQHIQNWLGVHWWETFGWWDADRHLTRGIIIGLVASALVQSVTAGIKVKPLSRWQLVLSPVLITAIVLPLTAAGVYLITQAAPAVSHWGTAGSIPYAGDWLAAGNWQSIVLGFVVLWPAKRVIRRIGATLQISSIDNKLLRGQTEKPWWRFAYLPNWLQRFRYTQARYASGEHVPRDHGRIVGAVLTVTVFLSLFLLVVGVLVTTVGPAAHAGH